MYKFYLLLFYLQTYEELISLASGGDFSNIHTSMSDLLSSHHSKAETNSPNGRDAICFPFGKTVRRDQVNSELFYHLISLIHLVKIIL